MASNASLNPGLSDLLQTLSNSPSLAPILSSPNAMTALENASPSDIVSLSAAASQFQDVTALFDGSYPTAVNSDPMANLFDSLEYSPPASTQTAADSAVSTATSAAGNQLVANQTALQQQELATLLGTGTSDISTDPLIDMFG